MFQIRKTINYGSTIPAWYGVAWEDLYAHRAVCYPIPLNVAISVLRSLWI